MIATNSLILLYYSKRNKDMHIIINSVRHLCVVPRGGGHGVAGELRARRAGPPHPGLPQPRPVRPVLLLCEGRHGGEQQMHRTELLRGGLLRISRVGSSHWTGHD